MVGSNVLVGKEPLHGGESGGWTLGAFPWTVRPVGWCAPLSRCEMADLLICRRSPFSAATRRTSLARASKVQPAASMV